MAARKGKYSAGGKAAMAAEGASFTGAVGGGVAGAAAGTAAASAGGLTNSILGVAKNAADFARSAPAASSGGGGGATGGVYVPPTTPTGPPADPAGGGSTDLGDVAGTTGPTGAETGSTAIEDLTEEQIGAALAAIEAQYGMTREQLLADRSMAGLAYQRLTQELARAREVAQAGVEQDALRRGLFDSGIAAQQQASLAQQFAEQRAAAAQERQARIDAINASLAQLGAQKQAEQAAEEARIRREALERQQTTTVV